MQLPGSPQLRSAFFALAAIFLFGCAAPSQQVHEENFRHTIEGDVLPWTDKSFDADDEKFTFAVFSDLTGGERDRVFRNRRRAAGVVAT